MKKILLSTAYFAPVQYYSKLLTGQPVIMEKHEHYNKQSYRNRCTICTANGLLDLVVPVVRSVQPKIRIGEVSIAYDTPWQKLHFKAIESAYRRSPFYEYYIDSLTPFFTGHYRLLYEFNILIMRTVCHLLDMPFRIAESEAYTKGTGHCIDLRNSIHPKNHRRLPDPDFVPVRYTQVFSDRFGFHPNLSILDMLFNMGADSVEVIRRSIP
ncbi:MAG: WbqC family protein [Bacteroidales bacterium]|nr:WbqC family protein [Bacteroidales bacterium]